VFSLTSKQRPTTEQALARPAPRAQTSERWFAGIVDRWFGEVDGSFEQRVTAEVMEPAVASGFPPPARFAEAREGGSRISDDPAATLAQYYGKLEGFNAEMRVLGPRIRRADLLMRIFNRREPAVIS
jgi:hypothetical protein